MIFDGTCDRSQEGNILNSKSSRSGSNEFQRLSGERAVNFPDLVNLLGKKMFGALWLKYMAPCLSFKSPMIGHPATKSIWNDVKLRDQQIQKYLLEPNKMIEMINTWYMESIHKWFTNHRVVLYTLPFWEWTIIAASKYQYHIGWEISPFVQQKLRDFFLTVLACHDLRYWYWWPKARGPFQHPPQKGKIKRG